MSRRELTSHAATPPAWLRWVAALCMPSDDREALLDDLDAMYRARSARGLWRARIWYARQAVSFALRLGIMRFADAFRVGGSVRGDLRVALRNLRWRRAYSFTFVLTLATGVGLLAAVYTAGRWVLLRPVPAVANPAGIVLLRLRPTIAPPHVAFPLSHPDLQSLRERLPSTAIAARSSIGADFSAAGQSPRRISGEMVTANYFATLGVRLGDGRSFSAAEETAASDEHVVVLSNRLAGAGAPAPLGPGSIVTINGNPFRVIGIAPPGFVGAEVPGRSDFWITPAARPVVDPGSERDITAQRHAGIWELSLARPGAGVSVESVGAAAAATIAAVRSQFPMHSFVFGELQFEVTQGAGLDPAVRQSVRTTLTFLGVAAVLLLLLALGNLVNLVVIESLRRRAAIGVRIALGARGRHVLRLWTVEGLVLAVCAAILAVPVVLAFAMWFRDAQLSEHGASLAGMIPTPTVALVCLGVAMLVAVISVARPALSRDWLRPWQQVSRLLRPETRMLQGGLVATQVALSLALLVLAAILHRTVENLRSVDLGFAPNGIAMVSMDPHLHGLEGRRLGGFASAVEAGLGGITDVRAAGLISPAPFASSYFTGSLSAEAGNTSSAVIGAGFYATPGALAALNPRIVAGRAWSGDSATVVLTLTMWRKLFPGVPPAEAPGRLVYTRTRALRVESVIEDMRLSDVTTDPPPTFFRRIAERPPGLTVSALIATPRRPADVARDASTIVAARAPNLPLYDVRSVRSAVDLQFAERNAMARVGRAFGVIGLFLAAVGLYGVVAGVIGMRRREIGVRAAMGASPLTLLRWVLSHALAPVLVGIVAGIPAAHLATRLLENRLYGVERFDVLSYVIATGLLLLASILAAMIPAVGATRVSATEVLRSD